MGLQIRQSKFIGKKTLTFMAVLALLVQPFAIISLGSSANALSNGPFSLNTVCEDGKAVLNLEARQEVPNWIAGTVVYQTPHGIQNHSLSVDDVDVWKLNTGQVEIAAGTAKAIIAGAYRWGFYNQTFSISYSGLNCDNERPTVTVNTPNGAINPATISVTANDNHRLQQVTAHMYDATNSTLKKNCSINVAASNIATYTISCSTTGLADGVYTIRTNARDTNGNLSLTNSSTKFTIDNTGPTITVQPSSIGSASIYSKIGFNFYDVNKVDYITINGVVKDLTNAPYSNVDNIGSPHWYGAFEGLNTLVAYDALGNSSTIQFTIDKTYPVLSVDSPIDAVVNGNTLTVGGTVTDENLDYYRYQILDANKENTLGSIGWSRLGGTNEVVNGELFTADISELADGTYHIRVWARDLAGNQTGNITTPYIIKFTIDRTAPDAPSIVSANKTGVSGTAEASSTVTIEVDGVNVGTAPTDADGNWEFTFTPELAIGTHDVSVFATDGVGNPPGPSTSVSIVVSPPIIPDPVQPFQPLAPVTTVTTSNSGIGGTTTGDNDQTDSNVLGVQSETDKDTLGASTENTAVIKPSAQGWNIYGLAWYWWLLILAALAAGIWWLIAARRRNSEEA